MVMSYDTHTQRTRQCAGKEKTSFLVLHLEHSPLSTGAQQKRKKVAAVVFAPKNTYIEAKMESTIKKR